MEIVVARLKLPPVDMERQAARLAKATGDVPPPLSQKQVKLPPGFTTPPGGMLLKPGQRREVVEASPESLRFTEAERKKAEETGWTPASDVTPGELGDVLELLEAEGAQPGLDDTAYNLNQPRPKTDFVIKDYDAGTAEEKANYDKGMEEAAAKQKQFDAAVQTVRAKQAEQQAANSRRGNLPPSVQEAVQLANKMEVIDDLDAKAKKLMVDDPTPQAPPGGVKVNMEPKGESPPNDSGAAVAAPTICANCGHSTEIEPIKDLPAADKEHFVTAVMMGRAYTKSYPLLTKMEIKFRTLTVKELDACYVAASRKVALTNRDNPGHMLDIYELILRNRLCLQFQALTTSVDSTLNVDCPDGLHPSLSLEATAFWNEDPVPEPTSTTSKEVWTYKLFERIYTHLETTVFKQEHLLRITLKRLMHFNREVKWMEDQADNPDFLQPTEKQPS